MPSELRIFVMNDFSSWVDDTGIFHQKWITNYDSFSILGIVSCLISIASAC